MLRSAVIGFTIAISSACAASAQPVFPQANAPAVTAAPAQPGGLIKELTPDQVVTLLNGLSFPSKVTQDDKQNKWVVTSFWGDNLYSGVLFAGSCDAGGCDILNFFANFGKSPTVNQTWVNSWNAQKCCVKAFLLQDQTLVFEYDLPLFTGVTEDYVKSVAEGFKLLVDGSVNFKP